MQQVTTTLHNNTKCIKFEYTSPWKYSKWWLTLIVFGRCEYNYHTIMITITTVPTLKQLPDPDLYVPCRIIIFQSSQKQLD